MRILNLKTLALNIYQFLAFDALRENIDSVNDYIYDYLYLITFTVTSNYYQSYNQR